MKSRRVATRAALVLLAAGACSRSTALHPDAGTCPAAAWRAMTLPPEAAADQFASVGGTDPADVWICSLANAGTSYPGAVHLLHWNGQMFAESPLPPFACVSLWASAAGELWAGGAPHHVAHLVGGAWADVNLSDQRPASAIWSNRPNNVWIAGAGAYWAHWDGVRLSPRPIGGTSGTSLSGTGDDDLWTNTGHATTDGTTAFALAGISNGTAIWAADDAHVWLVGNAGAISFFSGPSWTMQTSGTTNDLNAVWGASAADVWAVGAGGTIVHWDGSSWSTSSSTVTTNLHAIWGSDACNVWAVGDDGTVLARRAP
jgi:hypothetical protein